MIDNIEIEDTKKYLGRLETELVMAKYNDGWYNEWLKNKITELKLTVDKYKHKF